jgi:hypothetical protein
VRHALGMVDNVHADLKAVRQHALIDEWTRPYPVGIHRPRVWRMS